jgi:O-antigen/teichoic acid export membrane protein/O-antigen ligase
VNPWSAAPPQASATPAADVRPAVLLSLLTNYGSRLLGALLSLASVLVTARALGPAGRGDVVFLTTVGFMTSQFFAIGMDQANSNLAARYPAVRRALAGNSVLMAVVFGTLGILAVAGLMALVPSAAAGSSAGLRWLVLASVPALILQLYLRSLTMAAYRFLVIGATTVLAPLINVVGALVLLGFGALTVTSAVVVWVAGQLLCTFVLVWYVGRRLQGFGAVDPQLARGCLRFGVRAQLPSIIQLGNLRVDQWLLGALAGARQLGLYSVAVAWAEALFLLPLAIIEVQRPDLARDDGPAAGRRAAALCRAALLAMLAMTALMVALAPLLCVTVFGEAFRGSVPDLRILAVAMVGLLLLRLLGDTLTAQRLPLRESVAVAVSLVVGLGLDIILIPPLGGLGASYGAAAGYGAGGLAAIVLFTRSFGVRVASLRPRWGDLVENLARVRATIGRARPALVPVSTAEVQASPPAAPEAPAAASILRRISLAAVPAVLFAQVFVPTLVPRQDGLIVLVVVGVELALGRARLALRAPTVWTGAYILLALASGWWAPSVYDFGDQLLNVLVELPLLLAFATLLTRPSDLRPILWVALGGAALTGAYAIVTFVSGSVPRAMGFQGDPNQFAMYQLMALPFALVALGEVKRPRSRRLVGLAAAVIVISALTSLSRGGLIALAVVLVMIAARPAMLGLTIRRGALLAVMAVTLLGASVLVSGPLLSRVNSVSQDTAGGSGRVNLWLVAWVAIERHPALGLGYGGYRAAAPALMSQTPGVDLLHFPLRPQVLRAHNVYLETAAELGLSGLAILLALLLSTALALRRAARRADELGEWLVARTARAALLALFVWATASIFLSSLPTSPVWAVFGLALCLPAMLTSERLLASGPGEIVRAQATRP